MVFLHLLPLLLVAATQVLAALVVASRWLPEAGDRSCRMVATVLVVAVLPIAEVTVLSILQSLRPAPLACLAIAGAAALVFGLGPTARNCARADMVAAWRALTSAGALPSQALAFVPALASLIAVFLAAAWLEVWAYDALGYHLPVVYDALDSGGFRHVPSHIPYVNVYPRGGERLFAWVRLLLADDGWIDLAQLPAAFGAVVITATLARRAGASVGLALACASMWLAVPAVALQIPTNYVDVYFACWLLAAAYLATGVLDLRRATLFGVALALLLSCKAVALVPAAVCGGVYVWRSVRLGRPAFALVAAAFAMIGTPAYWRNIFRFGNPVWPVEVVIGPLRFPGTDAVGPMYVQGLKPSIASLPAPLRFVVSLVSEPTRYLYDMRLGGFGPVVQILMVALPVAALLVWWKSRTCEPTVGLGGPAVVAAATLPLPMAQWPRFSLAVPAALLVCAAFFLARLPARARSLLLLGLSLASLIGLVRALPGFTGGEGPHLLSLAGAPFETRMRAASIDAAPAAWHALKASLTPGDAIAYDRSVEVPGVLWRRDGATRVEYLDWTRPPEDLPAWFKTNRVRAVLLGRDEVARNAVRSLGNVLRFRDRCPEDPCDVYDIQATR